MNFFKKKIKLLLLAGITIGFLVLTITSVINDYYLKIYNLGEAYQNKNTSYSIESFNNGEMAVFTFLKDKKVLDDIHIAAIMSNMYCEGMMDPTSVETIYDEPGKIGPKKQSAIDCGFDMKQIDYSYALQYPAIDLAGIGLCGWTNGRNTILMNLADEKGSVWYDINVQLDLFWMEFSPYADKKAGAVSIFDAFDYAAFMKMSDIDDLTKFFMNKFEGIDTADITRRRKIAKEYYQKIISGSLLNYQKDYVKWALDIAANDLHGYCQLHRTGEVDYDCSSLVYYALLNCRHISDQGYPFTTVTMGYTLDKNGFKKIDFKEVGLEGLCEGDILVNPEHTEIYIGNGQTVGAHIDASGRINCLSGEGDQDGNEIRITSCGVNWNYVYRK